MKISNILRILKYWEEVSGCNCESPDANGGCLSCDMIAAQELYILEWKNIETAIKDLKEQVVILVDASSKKSGNGSLERPFKTVSDAIKK